MKKRLGISISILILCLLCSITVFAHSGSGYSDSSESKTEDIVVVFLQWTLFGISAGGGTFLLLQKAKKARRNSRQAMGFFAQMGDNWNSREIQCQVEEAYFQIQECQRRMDITYGAPYLSEEMQKELDSKMQWMKVRNEEIVQMNVRLLSAMPVCAQDEPDEEQDVLWYLIHGKMVRYYIDGTSRQVIRGETKPEAFFEYWKFVYRNKRWVLDEIRQQNEMDIDAFENTYSNIKKLERK